MKKIKCVFLVVSLVLSVVCCGFSADAASLKLGDVNGDGVIDVDDCVMITMYEAGKITLSIKEFSRADVNSDNAVNYVDAKNIAKYLAKLTNTVTGSIDTPIIHM